MAHRVDYTVVVVTSFLVNRSQCRRKADALLQAHVVLVAELVTPTPLVDRSLGFESWYKIYRFFLFFFLPLPSRKA